MKTRPPCPKILVSACLTGCCSRYDAAVLKVEDEYLRQWLSKGFVLPFCPETAGGLSTPRIPAEITGGMGKDVLAGDAAVQTRTGADVTAQFIRGAYLALTAVSHFGIQAAVLKDGSPSCGITRIYDGSFRGRSVPGQGVAAAVLAANRISLYNERSFAELNAWISKEI